MVYYADVSQFPVFIVSRFKCSNIIILADYKYRRYFAEPSSIALAHLSQYFSTIIAPSELYLTNFVAGSQHAMQNLEFFSALEVKGSIAFSIFSNNHILSIYVSTFYIINYINSYCCSIEVTWVNEN